MKTAWFPAAIALLLFSCSSEEPAISSPEELQPLLFEDGSDKREYVYNDLNQLVQIKFVSEYDNGAVLTSTQNFVYRADGKISEANSDTGFRFVYTYSGDKISRTDDYINDSWTQYHSFTYHSNGKLKESVTYQNIPDEGGIIPTSKEVYQYNSAGNLERLDLYYYKPKGIEAVLQTTFLLSDYDNFLSTEELFETNIYNPGIKLSRNNPGKLIIKNGLGNIANTEEYTYQYNVQGYAHSKATKVTLYNGSVENRTCSYSFK